MNRFSRIRHHVSVEDVKKKRLESIAVENFIKTEKEISKTISEKFKHNWRKELEEGMTTPRIIIIIFRVSIIYLMYEHLYKKKKS